MYKQQYNIFLNQIKDRDLAAKAAAILEQEGKSVTIDKYLTAVDEFHFIVGYAYENGRRYRLIGSSSILRCDCGGKSDKLAEICPHIAAFLVALAAKRPDRLPRWRMYVNNCDGLFEARTRPYHHPADVDKGLKFLFELAGYTDDEKNDFYAAEAAAGEQSYLNYQLRG